MTKRKHGAFVIVLGVLISLLAVTSPSSTAAPAAAAAKQKLSKYFFYGQAGGSQVNVLGNTVRHDLTGASSVQGFTVPKEDDNRVAGVNVAGGLVKIGAVSTFAKAQQAGTGRNRGTRITTGGRTADVSVLGGLIKVDAVETVNTAVKRPSGMTSNATTKFVGLTIAGKHYPITVKKNTSLVIPGVAAIVLNGTMGGAAAGGQINYGYGLYVQLLKPFKNVPAAATVVLNPTSAVVTPAPPVGSPVLSGAGYGSQIKVDVGQTLGVDAGPTAFIPLPPAGTNNRWLENSTAEVNLPNVLHVGAVTSRSTGMAMPGRASGRVTNQIGGVNLLNGTITADAIKVTAGVRKVKGKALQRIFVTSLVNLRILGEPVDVNTGPNTRINVADLGTVTINKQQGTRFGAIAKGVEIRLNTERAGLPVGALIELGVASAFAYS